MLCTGLLKALNMVYSRHYLDKARDLAGMLPPENTIKLHKKQCLYLQKKLEKTLERVVGRVESCHDRVLVLFKEVFKELHLVVQKVKTFVDTCCFENDDDFVLAAIRVTAHKGRFYQYHVELDWCSFLVKCLRNANLDRNPVYCQTLQKFDWEQKLRSLLLSRETSTMITEDEGCLKALLESWIAKPGQHQAICWALLRRFEAKTGSDLHILPGDLKVPPITTLGNFIGSGAYGAVYEIKWKENLFAVKFFEIENAETINNEVRILESCCHPHIVNLILAYREDRKQYLMMERLSSDLESYIKERKKKGIFPFPVLEVVDMISQVCEGMLYLNEADKKVSHRDLKPKNILVKELNSVIGLEIPTRELQVADFGLAKERKSKELEKPSTSENTPNCGTRLYRDPELTQTPGGEKIRVSSMKADMYSFAVTCSFILTGSEPYRDYENTTKMIEAVKGGARPDLPADCPEALANLLKRCWHKDLTRRPLNFYDILLELRKLKANLLTRAVDKVEQRDTEPPEEPMVTFNSGDRRLNILVLGHPESVEAVVSHICGAGRRQTWIRDHVNLKESKNYWPPMCLYGDTKGISRNDFTDIKAFVKVRNEKWHWRKVEPSWVDEVHHSDPRDRPAFFTDSTLRLHMVWFVCRKLSDLPDSFKWSEITEKLCDLPVQILVIQDSRTVQRTEELDLNLNVQQAEHYNKIIERGSDFFPKARNLEELIVKVAFSDGELKEKLWHICWAAKTRAEIGSAAKIIKEIRRRLGSAGKSVPVGVGGGRIPKEVSLRRSGEFVLNFLCTYWDIPQDSVRRVLQRATTFTLQASGNTFSIKPYELVKFCLIVAAIILYNARDNARNPKYVCNWNDSSEPSLGQLLQTEARECYNSYFASSTSPSSYDKMVVEDIRLFLQSIFEREGWAPRPVVVLYPVQGKLSFAVTGPDNRETEEQ